MAMEKRTRNFFGMALLLHPFQASVTMDLIAVTVARTVSVVIGSLKLYLTRYENGEDRSSENVKFLFSSSESMAWIVPTRCSPIAFVPRDLSLVRQNTLVQLCINCH